MFLITAAILLGRQAITVFLFGETAFLFSSNVIRTFFLRDRKR